MRKNEQFIEFFQAVTPVQELGRMNIGSRPAKRKAAGSIDDLRAIPWIFAWTQIRFHLPVWLGIGQAFEVSTSVCQALNCLAFYDNQHPCVAGRRGKPSAVCYHHLWSMPEEKCAACLDLSRAER